MELEDILKLPMALHHCKQFFDKNPLRSIASIGQRGASSDLVNVDSGPRKSSAVFCEALASEADFAGDGIFNETLPECLLGFR